MTAAPGGLDAVVFTTRCGKRSRSVREQAYDALGLLGVHLDGKANARASGTSR